MRVVEFGSLFEFIRNGMSVKQDKSGDGLPISRIETIADATIDASRVGYAGVKEEDCRNWLMKPGDILFSHINSVEHIGKCAVYRGMPEKLVHGMNLLCLRCDQTQLLPEFAKYLIRSPNFRARLGNFINKAVNQASVSIGNLKPIPVRIPNLAEQRRIAAILDQADALRVKRREALAQLDSLTQSIFMEVFGDPMTNPKGWKTEVLDGVASFFAGNSLPEGEPFIDQEDGFFLMKVSDMNLPGNEKTIERCQSWSSVHGARSATCPAGSIIIPKRGGAIGTNKKRVTTRTTILDPNVMGIFPNSALIDLEYFFQWFLQFDLSSIASGSSVPQLNKQDLSPLKIQVPPLSTQQAFAGRIQAVELLKASHRATLAELDTLFASLQHRAFQGEL